MSAATGSGATKLRVLVVTGAYAPELSGGSIQARALILALAGDVDFTVFTVSRDPTLPPAHVVDGVPVRRVTVEPRSAFSTGMAAMSLAAAFARALPFDVVHVHGYTRKCALLALLASMARKPLVFTHSSLGYDDAASLRAAGRTARLMLDRVSRFVGVSPAFAQRHTAAGLDPARFVLIPNGVDLSRFRPPLPGEQAELRAALGLPATGSIVLSIGFFSRDKAWDVLADAWRRIAGHPSRPTLVLLGPRCPTHWEVDPALVQRVERETAAAGLTDRLLLVERVDDVERWHRAADVFVLPSVREGLPNALIEAMATGRPCVASHIPGVTDALVEDGASGRLVPPRDVAALAEALGGLLADEALASRLGAAAQVVAARHDISLIAARNLAVYQDLTAAAS